MSDPSRPRDFLPLHPRDLHILLVLLHRPLHGYGIVQRVEEQSEGRLRLDPANLYRTLRRLEEEGLLAETEDHPEPDDARRRRYYALTGLGRDVLRAEVERMRTVTAAAELRLRGEAE